MPPIEAPRVVVLHAPHRFRQLADRAAPQELKVRRHQAVRVHLDPPRAHLPHEPGQEAARVRRRFEQRPLREPTVDDVMPGAGCVFLERLPMTGKTDGEGVWFVVVRHELVGGGQQTARNGTV